MKNLTKLPLIALAVACCLFGTSFSDAKVKSPSVMLMCLLFTLVTGIGFWIHSLEPCDKSKPGVEDKLLKKMAPSTPDWLQTLTVNSEDIDDMKDKNLLKERNNSVPYNSKLDDKLNNSPTDKFRPDSKDEIKYAPISGRSQSFTNLPNYDKKPGSGSPDQDGKFGFNYPRNTDSINSSDRSLLNITNQDDDPKSDDSPASKPSADSKLPPSRSMSYSDSPADKKKPGQPGKKRNRHRDKVLRDIYSSLTNHGLRH